MKHNKKQKLNKVMILTVIVVIATLIVGTLFIYVPFLNKTRALRAKILEERERNVLIGKIRALGKHLKVYKNRIPENKGVSWLLSTVSDMASREDINVVSIKPDSPEDFKLYNKLYVVLDTVSKYNQLGRFTSRVESSREFLKIESIEIERLDSDENFSEGHSGFKPFDVKAHIVISTMVLKE